MPWSVWNPCFDLRLPKPFLLWNKPLPLSWFGINSTYHGCFLWPTVWWAKIRAFFHSLWLSTCSIYNLLFSYVPGQIRQWWTTTKLLLKTCPAEVHLLLLPPSVWDLLCGLFWGKSQRAFLTRWVDTLWKCVSDQAFQMFSRCFECELLSWSQESKSFWLLGPSIFSFWWLLAHSWPFRSIF